MCQSEVYRSIHYSTFHPSCPRLLDSKLNLSSWSVPACPLISFPMINNSLLGFQFGGEGIHFTNQNKQVSLAWEEGSFLPLINSPFNSRWYIVVTLLHGSIKKTKKTIKGHLNPIVSLSQKPKVTMELLIIRRADNSQGGWQVGLNVLKMSINNAMCHLRLHVTTH